MTIRRKVLLIILALSGLTIALGFLAWWTFVLVAFASAFILQKRFEDLGAVRLATISPALGWVLGCFVRDLFEDGRISAKLASLLHLQFSVAVYMAVFFVIAVPSFFAAFSGATASKALR
jgi:hypothetical protein